jgi:hypothetical protein
MVTASQGWAGTVKGARSSVLEFTRFTEPRYQVEWFHAVLCRELDKVLSGETRRLMVHMPPQHGKTEPVSRRLPALALGRNPEEKVIACSYNEVRASSVNRDVQRIMDSPEYRILFPDVRLGTGRDRYVRTVSEFEIVGHGGSFGHAPKGLGLVHPRFHYEAERRWAGGLPHDPLAP